MSWWRKLLKTISTGGPWMLPVAYLTCFTVVWGFLWALEEPLGISGGVHLGTVSLPGHVLHLLLAFLVAPHLALIAYHRAMHTSERLRDAESELRLAHAEREHQAQQIEALEAAAEQARLDRAQAETAQQASLRELAKERDKLRLGLRLMRLDQLTEREVAALNAAAQCMRTAPVSYSQEDKAEILRFGLVIACSDDDFRGGEQAAIRAGAAELGLPIELAEHLIAEASEHDLAPRKPPSR